MVIARLRGGQESSAFGLTHEHMHAVASTLHQARLAATELIMGVRGSLLAIHFNTVAAAAISHVCGQWQRALAVSLGLLNHAQALVANLSKRCVSLLHRIGQQLLEATESVIAAASHLSTALRIPTHLWIPWHFRALVLVAASLALPVLLPDWLVSGEMPVGLLLQRNAALCLLLLMADHAATNCLCRGRVTQSFSQWPELRALRHVCHSSGPDKRSISAVFVRISALSTPLWFKAVVSRESNTKSWYWTPYAQHEDVDWMPVSETKVNANRLIYRGRTPAWYNVRLIQFLRDHESETAAAVFRELE